MAVLPLKNRATATGRQIAEAPILWSTSVKCLTDKGFWEVLQGWYEECKVELPHLWRFLYLELAPGMASRRGC